MSHQEATRALSEGVKNCQDFGLSDESPLDLARSVATGLQSRVALDAAHSGNRCFRL